MKSCEYCQLTLPPWSATSTFLVTIGCVSQLGPLQTHFSDPTYVLPAKGQERKKESDFLAIMNPNKQVWTIFDMFR